MATIANNLNIDDTSNNKDNQNINTPVNVSGTTAQNTTPTVAGGVGTNPQGTSSGRFTNISNYLNANKNYGNNSGGLAGSLNNTYNNAYNTGVSQIGDIDKQIGTDTTAARNTLDPSAVRSFNPIATADTPSSLNYWQNAVSGTYKPVQVGDTSQFQNSLNTLNNAAGATNTEAGRFNLLKQQFGGNAGYNSGQQTLDNALLQSNPEQLGQLNQIQGKSGQLANQYQNELNTLNADNTRNAQEAQDTAKQAQGILGQQATGLNTDIMNRLKNASANEDRGYNSMKNTLSKYSSTGNIDPTVLKQLGIDPNTLSWSDKDFSGLSGQDLAIAKANLSGSIYNTNPSVYNINNANDADKLNFTDYLNPEQKLTEGDVVSQKDLATASALSKILGTNAPTNTQGVLNSISGYGKAGNYNTNANAYNPSLNVADYNAAVQTAKQNALNALLEAYHTGNNGQIKGTGNDTFGGGSNPDTGVITG